MHLVLSLLTASIAGSSIALIAGARAPHRVSAGNAPAAVIDSIRINEFVWYDATRRTVHARIVGAHEGHNGGMSFNGADHGAAALTVPVGWRVEGTFENRDAALAHSVIVVRSRTPVPVVAGEPAFAGAATEFPTEGTAAGEQGRFAFTASSEGRYMIFCAVPGHGTAGMWIGLEVSSRVSRPSYR